MDKHNICLIGLSKVFMDIVSKNVADLCGMFYGNVDKLIDFEFECIDKELGIQDYLDKQEYKVIKRICEFEDTLIYLDYARLNNSNNLNIVKKNCFIIYVEMDFNNYVESLHNKSLSKEIQTINKELFNDRNILCKSYADVVVKIDTHNIEQVVTMIMKELSRYLEENGEGEF